MKKLLNCLLLILALAGISACSSDLDSLEDGNHRSQRVKNKQMMKTVRMSFGGDFVTESEEPLLRAEEGDTYAAINVWRTEKKEGAKEEKYAYGLFRKKDGISLDVLTGYEYRFEATILMDYIDKYEMKDKKYYIHPFNIHNQLKPVYDNPMQYNNVAKIDKFQYSSFLGETPVANDDRYCFCQLSKGAAHVNAGVDYANATIFRYPRVKRFYGTLDDSFDPEKNEIVTIPMNYKSFGLEIIVESLPSGYVTVEDVTNYGNLPMVEPLLFNKDLKLYEDNSWNSLYSLYNLKEDSETFKLRFTWHKGGDAAEFFEKQVTVNAKTNKILKLKIDGNPNYETKGNIILETEDDKLTNEEEVISQDFR